jgi:hypothetical protein
MTARTATPITAHRSVFPPAGMTVHKQPTQATSAAPSAASSPTASSGVGASPSAGPSPAGSASAPAAGPTVSSAHLAEFLPSATTLTSLLIVEHLVQIADTEAIYTSTTDRPDCGGAINVGLPAAYDGSGYAAIRLQEYHDVPGDNYQYGVTEAVSTFPSDQQAQAFVSTEADRWSKCKYKPVTLIDRGAESFVSTILTPETNAGVLTVSTLSKQYSGLGLPTRTQFQAQRRDRHSDLRPRRKRPSAIACRTDRRPHPHHIRFSRSCAEVVGQSGRQLEDPSARLLRRHILHWLYCR